MPETPANAGKAGSPATGEPVYLAVGSLRRPHGLRGDIIMEVLTDFPERLRPNTKVFVGEKHEPLTIAHLRGYNKGLLLGFKGYDTPEAIGRFRNMNVYVLTADRPGLPEGQYYHYQILGLNVLDDSGKMLGTLTEILTTGANDVYVVSQDGKELLVPAIEDVILDVDLDAKTIKVHLLPGLMEGGEEE
jgi:16S rRNA processing protein RimM